MQSLLELNRIFMAHFDKVVATFSPKDGDHVVRSKMPGKKVYSAFLTNLPADVRDRYDWELFRNNFHLFGNLCVVKANLGEGELFNITPVAWSDPSELEEPFASAVVAARKLTMIDHSLNKMVSYGVESNFGFFVEPVGNETRVAWLMREIKLNNSAFGESISNNGITPLMSFDTLSCDDVELVIDTFARIYPDFDTQQVVVYRKALGEKRLGKYPARYLRWYSLVVEGKYFLKTLCHVNPKKEAIKRTLFELQERIPMPEDDAVARWAVYAEYREELYALIMKHGGARSLMMRMGDVSDVAFGAMHDVHHFTVKPNPDVQLKQLVCGVTATALDSTETITYEEFRENAVNGVYGGSSLTVTEVRRGPYAPVDLQVIIVPLFPEHNGKILEGYKWPYRAVYQGQFELRSIAIISEPYRALVCRVSANSTNDIEFDVKEEFVPYRSEINGFVRGLAVKHHDYHTVFALQPKCSFDVVTNNVETGETVKFTVTV